MSEELVIRGFGGKPTLKGTIPVYGAKNAVLAALPAALLFRDKVVLQNIPDIEDVSRMEGILRSLGVIVEKKRGAYTVLTPRSLPTDLPKKEAKRLRASIVLSGPILARFGKVSFPHPGGCLIGARPVDLFLEGFRNMGARVKEQRETYIIEAPGGKLKGAHIFFRNQSVTATETLMMAAVLAHGRTVLHNAALEPEIISLAAYLNAGGAKIRGAGTTEITIDGVTLPLRSRGKAYITPPDRIEAGSFLIMGALAARDLTITRCEPKHMASVIEHLKEMGVSITTTKSTVRVARGSGALTYRALNIKTHEYPGFPTDLQAPMTVFLTQAKGEALVFETLFEGRFRYVDELISMGSDILMLDPHRIMVRGPRSLKGKNLLSPDLRAGLAYIIAALIADGESIIHNVYTIDRGYERIEERLKKIGADIKRVKG